MVNKKTKINNNFLILFIVVGLLVLLILGYYFLYALPKHNQAIIELQREELEYQIEKDRLVNEKTAMKLKEKEIFENNLKCQDRLVELRKEYNNIQSIYYNIQYNTCYIRYFDEDQNIQETSIEKGGPLAKETPLIDGSYEIKHGVNFRKSPGVSGVIIQKIDPTNVVSIMDYTYIDNKLWYYIDMYGTKGWISSIAF